VRDCAFEFASADLTPSLPPYSVVIKVGMVGDSQIGKTSLMVKYVEGSFDEDYIQTLGSLFHPTFHACSTMSNVFLFFFSFFSFSQVSTLWKRQFQYGGQRSHFQSGI